jgi:hypothetical protein
LVNRLADNPINLPLCGETLQGGCGAIGGSVVDSDELEYKRHVPHPLHNLCDSSFFIVHRDDHCQTHSTAYGFRQDASSGDSLWSITDG